MLVGWPPKADMANQFVVQQSNTALFWAGADKWVDDASCARRFDSEKNATITAWQEIKGRDTGFVFFKVVPFRVN